ncbi:hypothetical protein J25TS5_41780 [Paenibacillus faecis]|nr:hypothetical protein J25TS5_41780 [Paenibacillus faecis]
MAVWEEDGGCAAGEFRFRAAAYSDIVSGVGDVPIGKKKPGSNHSLDIKSGMKIPGLHIGKS